MQSNHLVMSSLAYMVLSDQFDKQCLHTKLKLQQANVGPSVKHHQIATPNAGPLDYYVLASNLPTVIAGPLYDTPSTPSSSSLLTYINILSAS
jgi:hypothetical protein